MAPPADRDAFEALLEIARDLSASLTSEARYARLLASVRRIVPCDAACLLRLDYDALVPVAGHGLIAGALNRRYDCQEHPRLRTILDAPGPVVFPPDSEIPDPFDGLLAGCGDTRVHACLGCALRDGNEVVGALTADARNPSAFDGLDLQVIETLGALAAAAMRTTALLEALQIRRLPADATDGLPCDRLIAAVTSPKTIGRYKVVRRIGRGAMGSVYLALDPLIDRLVAIKVARTSLDDETRQRRFACEIRSIGRLCHANIPIIFDVGEYEGRPFIAMEYIEGETIAQVIAAGTDVTLDRKLDWMEQLCRGLACAHRAGIVHRDIKPANLIVDRHGVLKILDFGIARLGTSPDTDPGTLLGTLNYMSPEQVRGTPVSHLTDVFSAGAVFYELLAGRPAFAGALEDGAIARLITRMPPLLPPAVPDDVRAIVVAALQSEPERRYQRCEDMAEAIRAARARLHADAVNESPWEL